MTSPKEISSPTPILAPIIGSVTPHLLLLILQLFFLITPNFSYRQILAPITLLTLYIYGTLSGPFTTSISDAQAISLLWPITLSATTHFLLSGPVGPETKLWRQHKPTQEANSIPAFSFSRLIWATSLLLSQRGVSWNFLVKNTPPPHPAPQDKKWAFIKIQGLRIIYLLFITDLVLQLGIRLFWTGENGVIGNLSSEKDLSIRDREWMWSFVKAGIFGFGPYFMMELQYTAFAVLAVLLGISRPVDWPPLFGKLKEASTLRAFWGRFWHQSIRRPLTTLSNVIADTLFIPPKGNIRTYTTLFLSFLISGVCHANSMLLLPYPAHLSLLQRSLGTLQFFIWQACAITIEDFIQWVWRRYGGGFHAGTKIMGYSWVLVNFWASLPLAADVMMRLRLTEKTFLPGTLVGPWMVYVPLPETASWE